MEKEYVVRYFDNNGNMVTGYCFAENVDEVYTMYESEDYVSEVDSVEPAEWETY
jgi:hypothetical protein